MGETQKDTAEIPGSARASRALSGASPESPNEVWYSKRRLPHFERPWAKYAISFSTYRRRLLTIEERDIVLDARNVFSGAPKTAREARALLGK